VSEWRLMTLRNGSEAAESAVRVIMISLDELLAKEPIAFYELAAVCRDPQHVIFGNCAGKLRERGLLESSGKPHGLVRDVVLSAVAGEGGDMHLQSPEAEAVQ
jgi:hypothetical protein